jgi:uncharacterized membrane protein YjgN (DUF898 family)
VGIDWGYVYVATERNDPKLQTVIYGALESRSQFIKSGFVALSLSHAIRLRFISTGLLTPLLHTHHRTCTHQCSAIPG